MRTKHAILAILWISTRSLLAQTDIRLTPAFGIQAFQSYVKDDANAEESFAASNFWTVPAYYVGVEADLRRNWLFSVSVKTVKPKIAFKYGDTGGGGALQMGASCTSLAAGVERKISTHSWIKIKPRRLVNDNQPKSGNSSQRYLLLFRLKAIGGISRDWVGNYPCSQVFRNTNTSLFLGMGLQFFDRGKDKIKLSFIYSHGLHEIAEWDVTYVLEDQNYSGIVASKGSFFAVQVSYPLRLFTF